MPVISTSTMFFLGGQMSPDSTNPVQIKRLIVSSIYCSERSLFFFIYLFIFWMRDCVALLS